MESYSVNHLKELEAESIYLFREVANQFENPVLMFSGGKDSLLLIHLARKAFWPANLPFPILHVDTGHNFPEAIEFRDWLVDKINGRLIVKKVQDAIDEGKVEEESGPYASRNHLQIPCLLEAIEENDFDAAIGGARRDEEKSRAKERFFSHRDEFSQWNPKKQRPELWNLFNGRVKMGEHFRVFPLSNWTELDVWQYIALEEIEIPSLYLAHERECIERDGIILANSEYLQLKEDEEPKNMKVRFRTIGDMTCTGAVKSDADTLEKVIEEIAATRTTERGNRADDQRSEAAMEERKREGYF